MTNAELIAYFDHIDLPETLRINSAITQHDVAIAVRRDIDNIDDSRAKHRLMQIMNALENPYDGPEIPTL